MSSIIRQIAWFVAVGCAAAATHWLVVVMLVTLNNQEPLVANFIGWLVAFCVSFTGHYYLTFRLHAAPVVRAALRFFGVSALGFAINELAYAWLLQYTTLRYDVLLALILITIAGMTFVLGRYWAFRKAS
ncbi:MAG: GtrA family protein [Burkholderiaceae bacterium]|nr:GtrA family protein [Burkholderiaceae bacterium]